MEILTPILIAVSYTHLFLQKMRVIFQIVTLSQKLLLKLCNNLAFFLWNTTITLYRRRGREVKGFYKILHFSSRGRCKKPGPWSV